MRGRRTALPDTLAAALIGLAIFAFFGRTFLNYDTFYSLLWGGDLAHGRIPDYKVPFAPTPHPLAEAAGIVASLFGDSGEAVMLALVIAALGALVVGVFRLGEQLFGRWVGVLAALIVATRVPFLNYGIRGYVDLVEMALVVWSAVLEARRPRRGAAVLVLLVLAGLLRPEAWLYAGAYWLWLFPSRDWPARLRLAALVAAAPLAWGLSDLAISGDFLWSLHGTHDLASELGRKTGLLDAARTAPRRLGEIVRLPELIAAVAGLVLGVVWTRRRAALPAAVLVLNGVAFCVLALAGLSLLGRYLVLAGAMLAMFAALACLGWVELPPEHPARAAWRGFGL
ncbi:MAG TPA: glycosyltransferase family 39 protein, partial [Thermoleophilaceae bacterium]|nr:glycosyltransferase family 39 protein [Thermoleophilaceae bacterium]